MAQGVAGVRGGRFGVDFGGMSTRLSPYHDFLDRQSTDTNIFSLSFLQNLRGDNTAIRKYLLTSKAVEIPMNRRIIELYRKLQKEECLP